MASTPTPEPLSAARPPERTPVNPVPWILAAIIILIAVAAILALGHALPKPAPNAILPPDPYGNSLSVTGLTMSESTSLSGGKSTYIDGHVHNDGPKTVTAITVQVLFANDTAMPPQVETVPLSLVRTHEPYIDTQPISAAPLAPGDDREFRLIFEGINSNWNQQMPALQAVRVTTR
jgi:Protein of unknown function (DUF2393)